jgi:apolipoprotein N-acyltransferase
MGWVAVVGLSAFLALYPMAAAGLARVCPAGGLPRLLLFTGAFMFTEWLRGVLLSGFSWNPLGIAWLETSGMVQLAQYAGAQGLTGLMLLSAGGIWLLVRPAASLPDRAAGGLLLLVMAGLAGFGTTRLQDIYFPDNPVLVIVQPNIGQDEKYADGANARHLQAYLDLTRQGLADPTTSATLGPTGTSSEPFTGVDPLANLEERFTAGTDRTLSDTLGSAGILRRPAIVIWPESAVFGLPEEDPALRRRLASVLGPKDLLVFGGVAATRDATGSLTAVTNSLFILDSSAALRGRYDKAHLTPLGEYVPARGLMERLGLARLAPGDLDFTPGPGPRTLTVPGLPPMGAMICYEIIFGGRVTEYGRRPAWIANISNDAWFGPSGPPQHLAQARLRAIEEGLPIARATPTGVSAVIGPRGRIFASQPPGTSGVLKVTLPPSLPATPYARNGDVIPLGLAIGLALAGLGLGLAPRSPRS